MTILIIVLFLLGVASDSDGSAIPLIKCNAKQLQMVETYTDICKISGHASDECFDAAIKIYCGDKNETH